MSYRTVPGQSKVGRWFPPVAAVVAVILVLLMGAAPVAARTGSIQTIENADTIFVYEENLDLSALRSTANPVTYLRRYVDDSPGKAVIQEIPVQDDTSFTVYASAVGSELGLYYAYNTPDGDTGKYVRIYMPAVAIDAVLANPYHTDSIRGLSIPDTTPIVFKITSPRVGASYFYDSVYPATVDIVVTTPGGGELSIFQGKDFRNLNISTTEFYTDDPGMPGAFTFQGLSPGTYRAQARWTNPVAFDSQAPDSNTITWTIGGTPTPTATPTTTVPTPTSTTQVPTTTATATPTATPTTPVTTAPPVTTPATTPSTTVPAPTPAPVGSLLALGAVSLAALALWRRAP